MNIKERHNRLEQEAKERAVSEAATKIAQQKQLQAIRAQRDMLSRFDSDREAFDKLLQVLEKRYA